LTLHRLDAGCGGPQSLGVRRMRLAAQVNLRFLPLYPVASSVLYVNQGVADTYPHISTAQHYDNETHRWFWRHSARGGHSVDSVYCCQYRSRFRRRLEGTRFMGVGRDRFFGFLFGLVYYFQSVGKEMIGLCPIRVGGRIDLAPPHHPRSLTLKGDRALLRLRGDRPDKGVCTRRFRLD
jgi:hypothetical protein